MSMRVQDLGELTYGGLVTGAEQWDKKRIEDGAITDKDWYKKIAFYTYLVPGAAATIISAFGPRAMRGMEPWAENISHGFIYDFPRFVTNTVTSMMETGGKSAKARAVEKARQLANSKKQLGNGAKDTSRAYQHEFDKVGAW